MYWCVLFTYIQKEFQFPIVVCGYIWWWLIWAHKQCCCCSLYKTVWDWNHTLLVCYGYHSQRCSLLVYKCSKAKPWAAKALLVFHHTVQVLYYFLCKNRYCVLSKYYERHGLHEFIYSINKYVLNVFCVLNTVLVTGHQIMNIMLVVRVKK